MEKKLPLLLLCLPSQTVPVHAPEGNPVTMEMAHEHDMMDVVDGAVAVSTTTALNCNEQDVVANRDAIVPPNTTVPDGTENDDHDPKSETLLPSRRAESETNTQQSEAHQSAADQNHDLTSIVPQLASSNITYGDVNIAIQVLNAIAALNPKNRGNTKRDSSGHPTAVANGSLNNSDATIQTVADGMACYKQSNLRPFRKAIALCLDLHQRTMYLGMNESDHYEKRTRERSLKRQKMAEKDLYKKHIATTALRKGRVDRLQAALQEGAAEESQQLLAIQAMMIPDGHVDTLTHDPITNNTAMSTTVLPCLRSCYVCKLRYRELHMFYDQLCPECAKIGWEKRHQTASLHGRVAVVTGSRVKIGYHVCLKLLRAGCVVVATTRFPNAAVDSYRKESDFDTWKHNLRVYGLDLRDVVGIEAFTRFLKQQFSATGIDILINNACQTIRRPSGYYQPNIVKEEQLWSNSDETHKSLLSSCIEFERLRRRIVLDQKSPSLRHDIVVQHLHSPPITSPQFLLAPSNTTRVEGDEGAGHIDDIHENGASEVAAVVNTVSISPSRTVNNDTDTMTVAPFETTGLAHSAAMSQMIILPEDAGVNEAILPRGISDINGQQLDLRSTNSWLLKMEEVSTPELMECMFVNAIAPFVLNSRLKPLMTHPNDVNRPDRYIINVSAMEGKVCYHTFL
jgi:NAD(P)-dependent dehydrogenase (short-subunit alcohol dehydrogenase family)